MTTEDIIKQWLEREFKLKSNVIEISSVHIQRDVVEFGKMIGYLHLPDLYSRAWRRIREKDYFFYDYGISEFKKEGEKVKWYRIVKKTPFITK